MVLLVAPEPKIIGRDVVYKTIMRMAMPTVEEVAPR
jgi:hypothetical protein